MSTWFNWVTLTAVPVNIPAASVRILQSLWLFNTTIASLVLPKGRSGHRECWITLCCRWQDTVCLYPLHYRMMATISRRRCVLLQDGCATCPHTVLKKGINTRVEHEVPSAWLLPISSIAFELTSETTNLQWLPLPTKSTSPTFSVTGLGNVDSTPTTLSVRLSPVHGANPSRRWALRLRQSSIYVTSVSLPRSSV